MSTGVELKGGVSRRELLAAAAVAGLAGRWTPGLRIGRADAAATCASPPGFPPGIDLFQQTFENWAKQIVVDDLWTCAPRNAGQVVTIANWAQANGYRLR